MGRVWLSLLICAVSCHIALGDDAPAAKSSLSSEQTEFFEKKIRPVLVKHCYQCHSESAKAAKQLKGGLLLDHREGLLSGGDSGPAIVPGQPDETLLLEALRYETLKMPPQGKLSADIIQDFETWVKMGAPDLRVGEVAIKTNGIDVEAGRRFWSYQPLKRPDVPNVQDRHWPVNGIDRFILSNLEAQGMRPVADASRLTLVRRVYFDLIGLPPTPEQIAEFVNDTREDAYERLVDRLLGSPQFGERWGRHWLDVVRYAESLTLRGFILPEAWRYRDYVIDSFNADRPYDQFLREQVAGDLLPATDLAERQRQCVATTFLMLGNHNLEEQDKVQLRMDVVDEQLDVISKGFLGQTVTCARCHDHKFDPIPTRDYYALAGILRNAQSLEHANVSKWLDLPLPLDQDLENVLVKHENTIAELRQKIATAEAKMKAARASEKGQPGIIAAAKLPGIVVDDAQAKQVGEWKHSQHTQSYIGDGYLHDLDMDKGSKTLTFQPELPKSGKYEVRLAYTPGDNRTASAAVTVFSADGERLLRIDQRIPPPLEGHFVSLGQYQFEQNGQGFVLVSNAETQGHVIADAVQFIPVEELTPTAAAPMQQVVKEIRQKSDDVVELNRLLTTGPQRPRFMSVREEKTIEDCAVHIRGTVHNLGSKVPRGFLSVVDVTPGHAMSDKESGRRELGDWLADPANPLPARVMANRVWHWLLGQGLVRTVDNFGTTGELPSHPELLDDLATKFIDRHWSVKSLVREIVLSRTYRLSSVASPELTATDPENRLCGHANRRRLEAECLLDTLLMVGGNLDTTPGGSTIRSGAVADFDYAFQLQRRAVYWPVLRNSLPQLFEVFDFPDPSMVFGRRNSSTVAPQALFLMNSPFVRQQSELAARRLLNEHPADAAGRIDLAFRRILGRQPTESERNAALNYVQTDDAVPAEERPQRWTQLVRALLGTIDFRYVD